MFSGIAALIKEIVGAITTIQKHRSLKISLGLQQEDDLNRAAERYAFSLTIENKAELANSIVEWGCFGQGQETPGAFGRVKLRDLGGTLVAFTEPPELFAKQIPPIDKVRGRILLPIVQPNTLDTPMYRGLRFFFRPIRGAEQEFHFIRGEDKLRYWVPS
jgi:hypothetical protein